MLNRIALNAQLLSVGQNYRSAGISWYITNLLKHLETSDSNLEFRALVGDRDFTASHLKLHYSRWPTHRPMVRIAWEQLIQPLVVRSLQADLLHAMAFVAPLIAPCPVVVTVYDLSFLHYPETFRPLNRYYLRHFTAQTIRRAEAVIAISESTRRDVITMLNKPPEQVHTVYCGVDPVFRPLPAAEVAAFKQRHNLPPEFIFFLGTLEPRKNVEGLIRAYATWHHREPNIPPLIIGGGKGWYYKQIFALVETLNLTNAVRFVGYLPQKELPAWYNSATVFVYPSLFEGFGLPVLEAMACGTPVITSTTSSLPEIAQGVGPLVDPTEPDALTEAMVEVASKPSLRAEMRARGLQRATQFQWSKAARETVAIYNQVLNSN